MVKAKPILTKQEALAYARRAAKHIALSDEDIILISTVMECLIELDYKNGGTAASPRKRVKKSR